MPKDGTKTRLRILDSALELAIVKGLAATSLDDVIARTGITKGAFFYHFKSKQDLSVSLVRHFADHDKRMFDDSTERVETLSKDPLQQVLLLIGLTAELFIGDVENPGCLFASYCYQGDLFTEEVRQLCDNQLMLWTKWIEKKLKQAVKQNPPAKKVSVKTAAEMFNTVIEGAFVMARTTKDSKLIRRHTLAYRDWLELLFQPKQK